MPPTKKQKTSDESVRNCACTDEEVSLLLSKVLDYKTTSFLLFSFVNSRFLASFNQYFLDAKNLSWNRDEIITVRCSHDAGRGTVSLRFQIITVSCFFIPVSCETQGLTVMISLRFHFVPASCERGLKRRLQWHGFCSCIKWFYLFFVKAVIICLLVKQIYQIYFVLNSHIDKKNQLLVFNTQEADHQPKFHRQWSQLV